jgi:hypothetical protein
MKPLASYGRSTTHSLTFFYRAETQRRSKYSHSLTVSRSHALTFSRSHALTLSLSHVLTLSRSHALTFSHFSLLSQSNYFPIYDLQYTDPTHADPG